MLRNKRIQLNLKKKNKNLFNSILKIDKIEEKQQKKTIKIHRKTKIRKKKKIFKKFPPETFACVVFVSELVYKKQKEANLKKNPNKFNLVTLVTLWKSHASIHVSPPGHDE